MKICAYYGNLYMEEFKNHVAEIKGHGFDSILFCITETDLLYNLEIFKEFRAYAEVQELGCWANFWGGAGVFGGEAISSVVYEKHLIGAVFDLYHKFLKGVMCIGFKHIFIDEPKFKTTSEILDFIQAQVYFGGGLHFHACFCDKVFDRLSDEEIRTLPVKSVGLSAYTWNCDQYKVKEKSNRWFKRLSALRPNNCFVFLQGFELKQQNSLSFTEVYHSATKFGITDFGFWSFRGTAGTGCKRCENPELVWGAIKSLFGKAGTKIMFA